MFSAPSYGLVPKVIYHTAEGPREPVGAGATSSSARKRSFSEVEGGARSAPCKRPAYNARSPSPTAPWPAPGVPGAHPGTVAQVPGLRRPRDVKYLTGAGGWARYTLGPEGSKRHYREASPPAPGDCVEPLEFGVFPRLSDEQVAILVEDQETQQKLLRTPVLSPLAWGPSRAPGTAVAALPQAAPVAASATLPARRRFGAPTPLLQIKTQDALGMWWQYTLTNDGKKAGLDLATPPSAADYIEPSELHDTDSLTLQQISAVVAAQARRTKPQPEPAIAGSLAAAPTPGVTEEPWLTTALDHPEAWMSDLAGFDDAGQPTDPTRTPKR